MGRTGPEFFDEPSVFQRYMRHRVNRGNANDLLERPILREMVGSVDGMRIVDLGCGDAAIAHELFSQGAIAYVGVEGAAQMVEAARSVTASTPAEVMHQRLEEWSALPNSFDLAISRLVLHYIEDLSSLLVRIFDALKPGGRLIFSVEHPVLTAGGESWDDRREDDGWIVDRYFDSGVREVMWMGGRVKKYHRTIEEYVGLLQAAGFLMEGLRESRPRHQPDGDAEVDGAFSRVPLFLFLSGRRPPGPGVRE